MSTDMSKKNLTWHKVLNHTSDLAEGRVMTVTAGRTSICLAHFEGHMCALDNRCPHQGGPLGEGSIENGLLRCPWHGWDFHPCTGKPPGGYDDGIETFPVEVRQDGVYVGVPPQAPHVRTVSDVMVETMINWGVDTVFGMVGHSNLGLADAFRRKEEEGKLTFIDIRHEGAAAFAASAYGKLTGRPAACFAIAGPGSTNMYTGLWDARQDRAPILALTGQVNTQVVGTGFFQEVDLKLAFQAVAEFNQTVLPGSKHAELMSLAVKHAIVTRNVSHLTFPDEVQETEAAEEKAGSPEGRLTPFTITPPKETLDKAIEMIKNAKRPVIIMGHGARFHNQAVIDFAEELGAPVLTTFKGKGLIPDSHPLGCGVLGRSGTPIASWFMNESDLLIVVGSSFSNHTGITPKKPTIQIDFDPLALSKFHPIDAAVWGEIGITLGLIRSAVDGTHHSQDQRQEVADRWRIWKAEKQKRLAEDRGKGVNSSVVYEAMNKVVPDNAVISVDVGNNTYSFGRYFEPCGQAVLMSGYLGSIGFGYPGAMGAWAAAPDRPIVALSGDGGFGQYMGEYMTAVKYNMPIKHVLLNNSELGKISKEQRAIELEVWKTNLHNANFSEYAKSVGMFSIRVEHSADVLEAMKRVFAHNGPAMIEIITDPMLI